jgi:kinesin family member C2/C3
VTSPEQIFDIMAAGFEHRAVGCHDINAHSSRSHCLLVVGVAGTNISTGVRTLGKLTLCDLAGSERINKTGATGDAPILGQLAELSCGQASTLRGRVAVR